MGVAIAGIIIVASVVGFVWLLAGPVGQRGRAIRAERDRKANAALIGSMVAVVAIIVVLVARNR